MVELKDPVRVELVRELRQFRKGPGEPAVVRMAGLFYLVEALGEGVPERAFEELARLYEDFGTDPLTNVGAFFYLSGWGIGLDTVDQRRARYVAEHLAGDISTPLSEVATRHQSTRDDHPRSERAVSPLGIRLDLSEQGHVPARPRFQPRARIMAAP